MSLLAQISLRLALVAVLSFLVTLGWVLADTGAKLREEATVTAERVAGRWEARPGLGSIEVTSSAALVSSEAVANGALVLPGVCVTIAATWEGERRICNARDQLGGPAPDWFRRVFERVYAVDEPVVREVSFRRRVLGTVTAVLDGQAAADRAWRDLGVLLGLAAAMALGMTTLGALAVAHALAPARRIVRALRELQSGTEVRLPAFASAEFAGIAAAFNDLVDRLHRTTEERSSLTRRLFEVQENERRLLARELHDEFGQCLTAANALAATIEAEAPAERPAIAEDARAIGGLNRRMQSVLRGALARLRVPDIEEFGLEASLRVLVGSWNQHRGGRTRYLLQTEGDLTAIAPAEALGLYRVVQECLTNATRHGSPSRVLVRVARGPEPDAAVAVTVEDDGGGRPDSVAAGSGFGILGMRERIAALGGQFAIGAAAGGLSVSAVVPVRREAAA